MNNLIIQAGASADSAMTIFIMGPTATGKTELALALYEELKVELISVDSALVYRGMDIGTAKPDKNILERAPHHLIDIIDPAETYSAGKFRDDVLGIMQQSTASQRVPLLVGGTMMYFNALQKGIANMPDIPAAVKQAIEQEAREKGLSALHKRLESIDPVSAERINPNDPQRIKRAMELYEYTGKTLTEFWREQERKQAENVFPYQRIKIALMPEDRVELRKRIALRFDAMLGQGFVEEVEKLYHRGDLHADMPSIRAVGYRQVWSYLAGEYDFDEMRERAIIATAQLAKRQMTWLRREAECNFIEPKKIKIQKIVKNLKYLLS